MTHDEEDNQISNNDKINSSNFSITASFSEPVLNPIIVLSGHPNLGTVSYPMSLKSGTNSSSWGYDLSLQTLPDGNYTLTAQVTGTDLVGNQITNTNTLTIEVDTQIPTLTISSNLGIHRSNTANANDNISVSAQFSEEMIQYPKITLTGICLLYTSPSPRDS